MLKESSMDTRVQHKRIKIGQVDVFYREAAAKGASVVLLPPGYSCASYDFRNLMPRQAERLHPLAPDFTGAGPGGTPLGSDYSFYGSAEFLDAFMRHLELGRFALYLHDF